MDDAEQYGSSLCPCGGPRGRMDLVPLGATHRLDEGVSYKQPNCYLPINFILLLLVFFHHLPPHQA